MDAADDDYVALLATIQVQLDRINVNHGEPSNIDIGALRHIAKLAIEASKIKHG